MIYYIGNREMDMVKIGYSRDEQTIHTRIKQIQTYCPFHVEVIKIIDGTFQEEQSLHEKYKAFKTNHKVEKNEWFVFSKIESFEKNHEKYISLFRFVNDCYNEFLFKKPVYWQFYNVLKNLIETEIATHEYAGEVLDEFVFLVKKEMVFFKNGFDKDCDEYYLFSAISHFEKELDYFFGFVQQKIKEAAVPQLDAYQNLSKNLGGALPYGYVRNNFNGEIDLVKDEVDVVVKIFDMRACGMSLRQIAESLSRDNVPTKRGGTWAANTVNGILKNNFYIGENLVFDQGEYRRILGNHKKIIDKDLFYQVNVISLEETVSQRNGEVS